MEEKFMIFYTKKQTFNFEEIKFGDDSYKNKIKIILYHKNSLNSFIKIFNFRYGQKWYF